VEYGREGEGEGQPDGRVAANRLEGGLEEGVLHQVVEAKADSNPTEKNRNGYSTYVCSIYSRNSFKCVAHQ
jgi:hypothetical protein